MKVVFCCPQCSKGETFRLNVYGNMIADKFGNELSIDVGPEGRDALVECLDCGHVGRLDNFYVKELEK